MGKIQDHYNELKALGMRHCEERKALKEKYCKTHPGQGEKDGEIPGMAALEARQRKEYIAIQRKYGVKGF